MSLEEIQQSLPSASGSVDPNCSSVQRLKQLMEDVETIKAERDAIESELKSASFDMKNEFLLALQKDEAIDEPALSLSRIGQVLNPLQQQVRESVDRQQSLVADIQSAHGAFVSETGSCGSSRDTLYQELATAYYSYIELSGNLQEGTKFYNDLTQLLVVFQNKISDFVFARKTEKEELMKDLTTASSRQACPATPSLPSHYASTSGSGSDIPSNARHASVIWRPARSAISSVCAATDAPELQSIRHAPISRQLSVSGRLSTRTTTWALWHLSWQLCSSTARRLSQPEATRMVNCI
ncbi:programmed cell death 6-interacting protein-like [Drosophila miranda]|uniref:programmed cell death 6-interacting protein-like n=1 Tax=Drosophila miranda TaxID=7229 RepID=UPI0007E75F9F|nr:programmed cell death 6-interacting protein-like [Drosophila miranda]